MKSFVFETKLLHNFAFCVSTVGSAKRLCLRLNFAFSGLVPEILIPSADDLLSLVRLLLGGSLDTLKGIVYA